MAETPLDPGLHIVSTPIGRARDITLHALDVLEDADVLVAEDTRVLRKLLMLHGIALKDRQLVSHHDHSSERDLRPILDAMSAGKVIAYASDAGTPMVSDPGYTLVQAAIEMGVKVHSAPGASALLAALASSGLPSDRFLFAGFLSAKSAARQSDLRAIAGAPFTTVFYDTPKRLRATLKDCAEVLQPDRQVALCRELTKRHEQVVRGSLEAILADMHDGILDIPEKGELVIMFGPVQKQEIDDETIRKSLIELVESEGVSRASKVVADRLGVSKNRVYALALELKNEHRD